MKRAGHEQRIMPTVFGWAEILVTPLVDIFITVQCRRRLIEKTLSTASTIVDAYPMRLLNNALIFFFSLSSLRSHDNN